MKRAAALFTLIIALCLCALSPGIAYSDSSSGDTASVFVGEGLFHAYEKKLKLEDSADYFFTEESMSYVTFSETVLPLVLKVLDSGDEVSCNVFFSFGEIDAVNPFAYSRGVGAEIAALLNELRALYPEDSFYYAELKASDPENAEEVAGLNETVREYSLCEVLSADVSLDTGITDVNAVADDSRALILSFEKLCTGAGAGDSGMLFSDGVGYLFRDGELLSEKTGLTEISGTAYYFENGIFRPDYTGMADLLGTTCYVTDGVIDRTKNGTVTIGGVSYTFENGELVATEDLNKSYTPEELHAMKAVFLTFDDGPSPVTSELLDTMDRYGVKATFFVTKQPAFADVLKDAVSRGHAIGVHTASHDYDAIYASFDAWKADFDEVYNWIVETAGVTPTCYRFPGGSNTKRPSDEDKQKMKDYVHSLGMEYYDWNVVTGDGDYRVTAEEELTNATAEIDYRTVPVILAHDQDHNKSTAEALDSILKELTGRGYQFMLLGPGIPPVQQGENWDY